MGKKGIQGRSSSPLQILPGISFPVPSDSQHLRARLVNGLQTLGKPMPPGLDQAYRP